MKILVTGASGFVGHHLVKLLLGQGHTVVATGMENTDSFPPSVDFHKVDLTDREAVGKIPLNGIDGIIHLAGLAAVGPSFSNPEKYLTANPGMQRNLFEACIKQGVKPRVLVISSGTLYDGHATTPLTELSPIKPTSPYAESKLAQEEQGNQYGSQGFEVIIARPFNHIGPGQGPGFIVPDLTKQVVEAEAKPHAPIRVGNLNAKRDYTDVRDIVKAYLLLLERGKAGETYNICSGYAISGIQILLTLLELAKVQDPHLEFDTDLMRPIDIDVVYGDPAKLIRDTGWRPSYTLDQTLNDALDDWRMKLQSKNPA
jgi:GDP-4-dehydro-6-deoxy-D-mannose reductase